MNTDYDYMVGERIDQLMSLEIRPISGGLPSGYVKPLYEICRNYHNQPLCMLAAKLLLKTVEADEYIFIVTGAGVQPNLPQGETDGPPGAIALALSLIKSKSCNVVIITEHAHFSPIQACVEIALTQHNIKNEILIESYDVGYIQGKAKTEQILQKYSPRAIIFVERDGPNREGYFHGVRGDYRHPENVAHTYLLADRAKDLKILTVGIGDGGNEIGFGAVRDLVTNAHPFKGVSKGNFESGLVTVTETDVIVAASVSNWGAYGVCAAIAYLVQEPSILHSPHNEREMITACVSAGARDGANSLQNESVDGIDARGHAAFIQLLHSIVEISK